MLYTILKLALIAVVVANDDDIPVVNCGVSVTFILALLFDTIVGDTIKPFVTILITFSNDALTLPVTILVAGIVDVSIDTSVTLIASSVFDLKIYEPVPFAKILNIVPNDWLMCVKSFNDAESIDDVIWAAPKILYGESNPYPLLELFANKVGKSLVPVSTIALTKLKSAFTSADVSAVGVSADSLPDKYCCNWLVTLIPSAVFKVVIVGKPASNPLLRTSTTTLQLALTLSRASVLPPLLLLMKREPDAYIPYKPNEMFELFSVACPPLFTLIA